MRLQVSILVVLDDALVPMFFIRKEWGNVPVSILVVLDDALVLEK